MATLILTCNTGEGHNSCAKAIKEVYDAHGEPCEIVDALLFVSKWFSGFAHQVHTSMYQNHPKVFRVGYEFTKKHNHLTTTKGTFPYWVLNKGVDSLYAYVQEHSITTIICVHPLLMMLLTAFEEKYGQICKTAYVSTDYTCCPGVRDSHPEVCFIPDGSLKEDFCCENIKPEQIVVSGIPVRQQFYQKLDKKAAKAQFGIPEGTPHLLVMCGSMGCGPMEELLEFLDVLDFFVDVHITVVCGSNEPLKCGLSEKYADSENMHIHGYISQISQLMDSADLFITKPGGLSSTEAAVKGIPMVFVDAVGGCEDRNLDYFCSRGCAVSGKTPGDIANQCLALLQDPERLEKMSDALAHMQIPNSAQIIYETMRAGEAVI